MQFNLYMYIITYKLIAQLYTPDVLEADQRSPQYVQLIFDAWYFLVHFEPQNGQPRLQTELKVSHDIQFSRVLFRLGLMENKGGAGQIDDVAMGYEGGGGFKVQTKLT